MVNNYPKHKTDLNTIFCSLRCFIWTPNAFSSFFFLPVESKKLPFCGSGQQKEIFYSMAATIVRSKGNSYGVSCRKVTLFPAIVSGRGVTLFGVALILFSYTLPAGTSTLGVFPLNPEKLKYSTTIEANRLVFVMFPGPSCVLLQDL